MKIRKNPNVSPFLFCEERRNVHPFYTLFILWFSGVAGWAQVLTLLPVQGGQGLSGRWLINLSVTNDHDYFIEVTTDFATWAPLNFVANQSSDRGGGELWGSGVNASFSDNGDSNNVARARFYRIAEYAAAPVANNIAPFVFTSPVGGSLHIQSGVTGSQTLHYFWYHDGVCQTNYSDSSFVYYTPVTNALQAGDYWCVATNWYGCATSGVRRVTIQ